MSSAPSQTTSIEHILPTVYGCFSVAGPDSLVALFSREASAKINRERAELLSSAYGPGYVRSTCFCVWFREDI
jgi:hypothetical protein